MEYTITIVNPHLNEHIRKNAAKACISEESYIAECVLRDMDPDRRDRCIQNRLRYIREILESITG